MPQLNKGGKFVFGFSVIGSHNALQIPEQVLREYGVAKEGRVIIFTGSSATGGFCVTSRTLLANSKLKHILDDCPALANYEVEKGRFIRYKGRGYTWLNISPAGVICLTDSAMDYLHLSIGSKLISIRSSDIAFTMGAKGPLMDKACAYPGDIPVYPPPAGSFPVQRPLPSA